MSACAFTLDLSLVDGLRPALERLEADIRSVQPFEGTCDPIAIAAEAAVLAAGGVCGPAPLSEAVLRLMHPSATPFERGLAVGMALVLAARPERR